MEPSLNARPRQPALRGELARPAAVAVFALAALSWWLSVGRMQGMDAGPGVALGALGWFAATWLLMMAAMMLPAIAPVVAAECFPERAPLALPRRVAAAVVFLASYLAIWAVAGAGAYLLLRAGRDAVGGAFEWGRGGRWLAAGALAGAAAYQLSSTKRRWLARCRAPLGGPPTGAAGHPGGDPASSARGGVRAGLCCLASSWALMGALFALGAMSLIWMALVAALIAAERLSPLASPARVAAAGVLVALALGIAAVPASVPGLTVPGSPAADRAMTRMGGMGTTGATSRAGNMPATDHGSGSMSMTP